MLSHNGIIKVRYRVVMSDYSKVDVCVRVKKVFYFVADVKAFGVMCIKEAGKHAALKGDCYITKQKPQKMLS